MTISKDRDPIGKALIALSWLVEAGTNEVGVRELSVALGISASRAHRILRALCDAGFVRQNPTNLRYSLSLEFLRLAYLTIDKATIRQVCLPAMRKLVDMCNETVLLGLYEPRRQEMIFVEAVDSTHPLRYAIELNRWVPVYTGASGLAIMAFLEEEEIESIIKRTRLAPLTERSITDPAQLQVELKKIRRNGFAVSRGQRISGAVGFAAPIFSGSGRVLGDICITIPEQRYSKRNDDKLVELLLTTTNRISTELRG